MLEILHSLPIELQDPSLVTASTSPVRMARVPTTPQTHRISAITCIHGVLFTNLCGDAFPWLRVNLGEGRKTRGAGHVR